MIYTVAVAVFETAACIKTHGGKVVSLGTHPEHSCSLSGTKRIACAKQSFAYTLTGMLLPYRYKLNAAFFALFIQVKQKKACRLILLEVYGKILIFPHEGLPAPFSVYIACQICRKKRVVKKPGVFEGFPCYIQKPNIARIVAAEFNSIAFAKRIGIVCCAFVIRPAAFSLWFAIGLPDKLDIDIGQKGIGLCANPEIIFFAVIKVCDGYKIISAAYLNYFFLFGFICRSGKVNSGAAYSKILGIPIKGDKLKINFRLSRNCHRLTTMAALLGQLQMTIIACRF